MIMIVIQLAQETDFDYVVTSIASLAIQFFKGAMGYERSLNFSNLYLIEKGILIFQNL